MRLVLFLRSTMLPARTVAMEATIFAGWIYGHLRLHVAHMPECYMASTEICPDAVPCATATFWYARW